MPGLGRITRSIAVMGGKPCVRGMRVTVGMIVGLVASRHAFKQKFWPPILMLKTRTSGRLWHMPPGGSRKSKCLSRQHGKFLIDMNLSLVVGSFLAGNVIEAVHWSTVGHPEAADSRDPSILRQRTGGLY